MINTHRIQLGHEETDVDVVLPNGEIIQLQYRLETPSIDVCLPTECTVTNWEGDDMEAAPTCHDTSHVHYAKQLVIDLDPNWVD